MSAQCEGCGRFVPCDTHSKKLHHPNCDGNLAKKYEKLMAPPEYSPEELKLFAHFGYLDLATSNSSLSVTGIYRLCVEKAFMGDMKGPAVEALRRGARAINDSAPYRMTCQFNDLVRF